MYMKKTVLLNAILVLNLLPTSVGFYFNCVICITLTSNTIAMPINMSITLRECDWRCNTWCIVWLVVRNDVYVLTCIATNIKISTSWFDVNFYFVYFIAPIITSHIIYLATNIHNISLKVLSSYALLISMHVAISMTTCLECESLSLNACVNLCCNALRHYVSIFMGMWRLTTRFVMMVIHNSSQT